MPDLLHELELLSRLFDSAIRYLRGAEEYRLRRRLFRWPIINKGRRELGPAIQPALAFVASHGPYLRLLNLNPDGLRELLAATERMIRGQLVSVHRLIRESQLQATINAIEAARTKAADGKQDDGKDGARSKRPRVKRQHRQQKQRALTGKQLEAVEVFGDCKYNYSSVARLLGLSITATKDRLRAAYKKLGQQVPKKVRTQALPTNRRGGASVAAGPKPEAQGDGRDRSRHDRRLD